MAGLAAVVVVACWLAMMQAAWAHWPSGKRPIRLPVQMSTGQSAQVDHLRALRTRSARVTGQTAMNSWGMALSSFQWSLIQLRR